jgi:hypothetical protein
MQTFPQIPPSLVSAEADEVTPLTIRQGIKEDQTKKKFRIFSPFALTLEKSTRVTVGVRKNSVVGIGACPAMT